MRARKATPSGVSAHSTDPMDGCPCAGRNGARRPVALSRHAAMSAANAPGAHASRTMGPPGISCVGLLVTPYGSAMPSITRGSSALARANPSASVVCTARLIRYLRCHGLGLCDLVCVRVLDRRKPEVLAGLVLRRPGLAAQRQLPGLR